MMMKPLCAALALLALTACGETDADSIATQVVGRVMGISTAPAQTPRANVSQEELLSSQGKYLRVNIRNRGQWNTMMQVGENGPRTTWMDSAGISVTLEDGIVVATRGLPRDLMGAETAPTIAAIAQGGGTVTRRHDFLNDQDQIADYTLSCEVAFKGADQVTRFEQTLAVVRFEERCAGEGLSLTNIYWIDRSGRMIRSLQAVSPGAGYLQIDSF